MPSKNKEAVDNTDNVEPAEIQLQTMEERILTTLDKLISEEMWNEFISNVIKWYFNPDTHINTESIQQKSKKSTTMFEHMVITELNACMKPNIKKLIDKLEPFNFHINDDIQDQVNQRNYKVTRHA